MKLTKIFGILLAVLLVTAGCVGAVSALTYEEVCQSIPVWQAYINGTLEQKYGKLTIPSENDVLAGAKIQVPAEPPVIICINGAMIQVDLEDLHRQMETYDELQRNQ